MKKEKEKKPIYETDYEKDIFRREYFAEMR